MFWSAATAGGGFAQEAPAPRPATEPRFAEIRRAVAEAAASGDARIHAFHLARLGNALLGVEEMAEATDVFSESVRLLAGDARTKRADLANVRSLLSIAAYRCRRCDLAALAAAEAVSDAEADFGPRDRRTAAVRLIVVAAYLRCGKPAAAEAEMLRALESNDLAPERLVDALSSLAEARIALGRSAEAAPVLDALTIALEEIEPSEHGLRARAASLRGHYESALGRPFEARAHFESQIRELAPLGRAAAGDLATAHAYLARLATGDRELARAEAEFAEAMRLMDPTPEDHRRPGILIDFAAVALAARDAGRASERAAAARDHPAATPVHRARALHVLGVARHLEGRPGEALPLFDAALAGLEGAPGGSAAFELRVHQGRARAAAALERGTEAAASWRAALVVARRAVEALTDEVSETERLAAVGALRGTLDGRLSAALSAAGDRAGFVADVADDVLVWKGQVLRTLQVERRRLRVRDDAVFAADRARLAAIEGRIASAMAAADRAVPSQLRIDPRLAADRDALERRLARAAGASRPAPPTAADVSKSLRADEALVDFVGYDRTDPADPAPVPGADERMAALVYRADAPPVLVPLGTTAALRAAIEAHLAVASRFFRADPAAASIALAAGVAARDAVWTPLAPYIREVRRVSLAPDGFLWALPFETLPGADKARTLIEDFEISYLLSAADRLATSLPVRGEDPGGVLLVGDVAFGSAPGAAAFPPLPRSKEEIDAVEEECIRYGIADAAGRRATKRTGAAATESRFKSDVAGKRLIHVASHGVFRDRLVARDAAAHFAYEPVTSLDAALPALASALAFAGAGAAARGVDGEDGLLTAAEAAWLDLSACELFVLSSCDSGLGVARAGEGVLGLRRALRLAGARAAVTAVWKIDDAAASQLFPIFYRSRFATGSSLGAALRDAKLSLLKAQRGPGAPHGFPATWGAFVLDNEGG